MGMVIDRTMTTLHHMLAVLFTGPCPLALCLSGPLLVAWVVWRGERKDARAAQARAETAARLAAFRRGRLIDNKPAMSGALRAHVAEPMGE